MACSRPRLVRILRVSHPPSARLLEVMAALGMGVEHVGSRVKGVALRSLARRALMPGSVALISGPSGGGKSTLLRGVHARLVAGGVRVEVVEPRACGPGAGSLLDALGDDGTHAARCLSAAGLADATVWVRAPDELSEGERARFAVARAWAGLTSGTRGEHAGVLLWDECASVLDRTTARSVCVSLARLVRRGRVSVVCATAHDDVVDWLTPDVRVWCGLGEAARVVGRTRDTEDKQ